jgi:hypothetical protein
VADALPAAQHDRVDGAERTRLFGHAVKVRDDRLLARERDV